MRLIRIEQVAVLTSDLAQVLLDLAIDVLKQQPEMKADKSRVGVVLHGAKEIELADTGIYSKWVNQGVEHDTIETSYWAVADYAVPMDAVKSILRSYVQLEPLWEAIRNAKIIRFNDEGIAVS